MRLTEMKSYMEQDFYEAELFGHIALFTENRVDAQGLPQGYFKYDLRHPDEDDALPATIESYVRVNYFGAVILNREIDFQGLDYRLISEDDFELCSGDSLSFEEYARSHAPIANGKEADGMQDAGKVLFCEQLLDYYKQEPVLFHPGLLDFATVPKQIRVLYAYEGEDEYGLRLYEAGKTVPDMPFVGTYLSVNKEVSFLATKAGETAICYRDIFTGRDERLTLRAYMKENGILMEDKPKKPKQEPER